MTNLLIAAAILFGAYYLIRLFARTPPAQLARMVKSVAGAVALVFAGLLFIRGRIEFAVAIGGVGLWLMGLGAPPGWLDQFRTAGAGRPSVSKVRSAALQMELDHDTGSLDGDVLSGPFEGRRLSALSDGELMELLRACRQADPEGARLLEAYLDRRTPGWGAADDADANRGRAGGGRISSAMTEDEAYEVLGLQKNATPDDISRAHRSLMKKLHPDQGGTTSLAARVNEAKDILMRRHR
ncbi:MAG: DnaJ domain-containing protein [Beijerinckiaceae bacterium]|nr:DnaJ domain-containing protein [Beijerinckiaceae bacterium]